MVLYTYGIGNLSIIKYTKKIHKLDLYRNILNHKYHMFFENKITMLSYRHTKQNSYFVLKQLLEMLGLKISFIFKYKSNQDLELQIISIINMHFKSKNSANTPHQFLT